MLKVEVKRMASVDLLIMLKPSLNITHLKHYTVLIYKKDKYLIVILLY